ncbi:hypothetical protein BCR39DRAFT_550015 [Naematelia encephala]|uniref:Uncharacterized protein n=1 Tax=Naematelia encephala TaxID=71784 RepID=A0A1Y2AKE9_9TREE|nr:hypothetical protein BCR39DRAFT_550015 [Naematelia encephala]
MLSKQPSRFIDRAVFIALAIPAVTSLIWPHVLPWAIRAIVIPAACLLTALTGMMNRRSLGSVAVRQRPVDALTRPDKRKIRRLNEMGVELVVEDNPRLFANLSTMQIFSLVLAGFSLIDHTWRSLLFPREEAIYARTVSASEHSITIGLRMPSPDMADTLSVQLCYRPQATSDLAGWELTEPLTLSKDNDWRGLTTFGGLASGTVYDYRLQSATQLYPPDTFLNFTTFADPGMARESHFRFIFSSAAIPSPQPYRPLDWLPRNFFRPTAPQSAPASGVRAASMEQPAWRQLGQWLDDMAERIAWAPIKFAILGDTELVRSSGSLGLKSRRELERSRQFLDAQDVRNVYERLRESSRWGYSQQQYFPLGPNHLVWGNV